MRWKIPLAAIAIAFLGQLSIAAQHSDYREFDLGLKLGGGLSRVGFSPRVGQGLNPAYTGGLVAKYYGQQNLGLQMEVNFLHVGWKEDLLAPNTYARSLNYIQLPVMTHADIGKKKFKMFIHLGPYIAYMISEKENKSLASEILESEYYGTKIENKAEFGASAGWGFSLKTNIGMFQLEGRVNYALSNIFIADLNSIFETSNNQSLEVSMSYMLQAGKR